MANPRVILFRIDKYIQKVVFKSIPDSHLLSFVIKFEWSTQVQKLIKLTI